MFVLDVILRTHNRADLLEGAIQSLLDADRHGIALRLLVVDNVSRDDTPQLLDRLAAAHPGLVVPLAEPCPGGQHALNRGLTVAKAPVVAFFDDDERVSPDWLQVIRREFSRRDEQVDFIAGPCRPLWRSKVPPWLPAGYGGVLGIIDNGPVRARFDKAFRGMLTQGNCALRREIYSETGPYPDALATAEDRWLYDWLLSHGKRGYYCPDLVIDHLVDPARLQKSYFRSWALREGRDRHRCERLAGEAPALHQPWYWRMVACAGRDWLIGVMTGKQARRSFGAELQLREVAAYVGAFLRG